jgi:hypothetical protein
MCNRIVEPHGFDGAPAVDTDTVPSRKMRRLRSTDVHTFKNIEPNKLLNQSTIIDAVIQK